MLLLAAAVLLLLWAGGAVFATSLCWAAGRGDEREGRIRTDALRQSGAAADEPRLVAA